MATLHPRVPLRAPLSLTSVARWHHRSRMSRLAGHLIRVAAQATSKSDRHMALVRSTEFANSAETGVRPSRAWPGRGLP